MLELFKQVLSQPDTVIQVGSGISCWSGLPTWKGLLEELADFLKTKNINPDLVLQKIRDGDFEAAAGLGFYKLTEAQQAEFLRQACRLDTAIPSKIHRRLVTMGPTSFVTTNFDHLLEKSFEQWCPGTPYEIVLNTQLEDQPTIRGSRKTRFLYKVHGDATHPESIIFTQKQYQSINLHGRFYHALFTLENLMSSRPFVYIGFGLKDTDFRYVQGAMHQLFQGKGRNSYAIMANVTQEEQEYYLKELGIYVLSYEVDTSCNPPSHEALLTLLNELRTDPSDTPMAAHDDGIRLRLAQHADRLKTPRSPSAHIPLLARARDEKRTSIPVEKLLDHEAGTLLLLGSSGGGKSYALKHSAARLAAQLNETIMQDTFDPGLTPIPILADLKLYKGDLVELLEESLPAKLSLNLLLRHFKPRIFLDAFNEIPDKYGSADGWDKDFSAFLQRIGPTPLIVSSRSEAGLEKEEWDMYDLDLIDRQFILDKLTRAGIDSKGIFTRELTSTLQTPLFYKLVRTSRLKLDAKTGPHTILAALLTTLDKKFEKQFGLGISLLPPMSQTATRVFYGSEEAFPLTILEHHLAAVLETYNITSITPIDIIHWLIGQEFLIPLPDRKVSFLHQSITEYMVASQLFLDFQKDAKILKEKFKDTGWDEVILYTLSLIDSRQAEQFIDAIWKIDFEFALSAVKFVQDDKKEVLTKKLLQLAAENDGKNFGVWHLLQHLSVNQTHLPLVREFVARGGHLGGQAIGLLIHLLGEAAKPEIFQLLREKCTDIWFCAFAAVSLQSLPLQPDDLQTLARLSEVVSYPTIPRAPGFGTNFSHAIKTLIQGFDPGQVLRFFYDAGKPIQDPGAHKDILYDYLSYAEPNLAIKMGAAFLLAGDFTAVRIFANVFSPRTDAKKPDLSVFTEAHCRLLVTVLELADPYLYRSVLSLIKALCAERKDLLPFFLEAATEKGGMIKVALGYCISHELFFKALEELLGLEERQLKKQPLILMAGLDDIDYNGHEALVIKIFKRGNLILSSLFSSSIIRNLHKSGLNLDLGAIQWWLDWFLEMDKKPSGDGDESILQTISLVIARSMSAENRKEMIAEFNNPASPYRRVLMRTIMEDLKDLTTADLTPDSIDFILDKKNDPTFIYACRILKEIADPGFVTTRILPLLKTARGKYRQGILEALKSFGEYYGIRYV